MKLSSTTFKIDFLTNLSLRIIKTTQIITTKATRDVMANCEPFRRSMATFRHGGRINVNLKDGGSKRRFTGVGVGAEAQVAELTHAIIKVGHQVFYHFRRRHTNTNCK